jgi:hypothetical protein
MSTGPPQPEWRGTRIMGKADVADLWRNAGTSYRIGLCALGLGFITALLTGIVLGLILTDSSANNAAHLWALAIGAVVTFVLALGGNYIRFQAVRRHQNPPHPPDSGVGSSG